MIVHEMRSPGLVRSVAASSTQPAKSGSDSSLVERRSDVQFKDVRARPLEVLKSANRPASSGRNDLVAALQCAQAQLASEA